MNISFTLRRNVAALAGAGLVATPFIAMTGPAFAADACQSTTPAATEVVPGVCEISFTSAGDYTFTAPSGVTKLSAIIVGAGGAGMDMGAFGAYAGGGGGVTYVASVDLSGAAEITVGAGTDSSSVEGGNTSLNSDIAYGGKTGTYNQNGDQVEWGGASGNGNAGSQTFDAVPQVIGGSGGGAGGAAADASGGVGLTASAAASDATLWPAVSGEPAFGKGGDYISILAISDIPGEGAPSNGTFGNDGAVYLRWAPALPDTGVNAGEFLAFATAFMIPGAALLALGMRGRRARAQR